MPLRQSRLNFGSRAPAANINARRPAAQLPPEYDRDLAIIMLDTMEANPQLPTPLESATDVSSQGSAAETSQKSTKSRSQRVVKARKSRFREEAVDDAAHGNDEQQRSMSGETLVDSVTVVSDYHSRVKEQELAKVQDQTSQGREEDPDNMHIEPVLNVESISKWDKVVHHSLTLATPDGPAVDGSDADAESVLIIRVENEEDDAERAAKVAARKAKMADNAQKWEARKKAAEKHATRRSNRASLAIEKAGNVLADIASSVLGKRSRDSSSKAGVSGQQETVRKTQPSTTSQQEPASKRARLDVPEIVPEPVAKQVFSRREKKWLGSGLYAGQARTFDARLNENSNKKRTSGISETNPPKDNYVLPLPMFAGERLLQYGRDFKLPFDVFSPAPSGQAKPQGWKKQNRNHLVGDACDFWREYRSQESSKCICTTSTGCDQNCLNRTMYYECDHSNCNLKYEQCGNRQWDVLARRVRLNVPYSIGVDVVKTADRGHGVRANRTFDPNQIILEYTGEIITQEECERRMRTDYKDNDCYYLMSYDQNMIIDATRGSMARFVNHSCEPNSRMEKWTVNGIPRMALYAGERGIMTGEELTYDYNFDPYSQKNVQKCLCGSRNCRGFLGPRPKDVKQKSPESDESRKTSGGKLAGAKRKMAEAFGESKQGLNKKKKGDAKKVTKKVAKNPQKKASLSPKKVLVVKKVTKRKASVVKTTKKSMAKKDSALKKVIKDVKKKAVKVTGKRAVSSQSMKETLIKKATSTKSAKKPRSASDLKEKSFASIKRNMIKSIKGKH